MGLCDVPNLKPVKLYCARCEDMYNPKSSRHATIDGAYFGTSFHNIIFQVYPTLIPSKSVQRYVPRVYGFKVHAAASLVRWQNVRRDDMRARLRKLGMDPGFRDDVVHDAPAAVNANATANVNGDDEDDDEDDARHLEFEPADGRIAPPQVMPF